MCGRGDVIEILTILARERPAEEIEETQSESPKLE